MVLGEMHRFFAARRNEPWMPTQIVQSACLGIRGREVIDALDRLTGRGVVERAHEVPGNPYTRAYRLVAPLVTADITPSDREPAP